MPTDTDSAPFNPLPPVVWALVILIAGLELILQVGDHALAGPASIGWRSEAINAYAFSPRLFDRMIETGQWMPGDLIRFVSYAFVHLGITHVLFVLVFLLALGKMVGELFSPSGLLAVFFGSAIFAALVYGLILPDGIALIGGYPAVYGLIGAYTFVLWTGLGRVGENRFRAFTLIGFLLGIQLLFGALFGGGFDWVADLAGFVAGFVLSFAVSPGGWQRLLSRMRQR